MAVPETEHYRQALRKGDTLPARPCIHWAESKIGWIERVSGRGAQIIGVELDEDLIPLYQVNPATKHSVVLLGHEHSGLPPEVKAYLDHVIEIPMLGVGRSLNVAVAGSLVLYKVAGLC
jgi:tRNA G18 (ribose-2'-O)-methylase SpoU